MADKRADQLNTLTSATIATNDLLVVEDVSANELKSITQTEFSKSVGDVIDSTFRVVDNADNSKKMAFEVSGVTTGTTRTITVPDATTTMLGHDATQTVTNKTIDPSLNIIDGDKLEITFDPTYYVPTTTGATGATDVDDLTAHLKGIDDSLGTLGAQREFFVPISYSTAGTYSTALGDFGMTSLASGSTCRFVFNVPNDFASIISADIIVSSSGTTTYNYSYTTDYGTIGEVYNLHSGSESSSFSGTTNTFKSISIQTGLTNIMANDMVGVLFTSSTSSIYVFGLKIRYIAA